MTWGAITDGRITLCGSGSSDCLALRVLHDGPHQGEVEVSSSYDEMPGHEDKGRFSLEPHEVYQFVYGYLDGALSPELQAAIDADMAKHPELPRIPEAAFKAVREDGNTLARCPVPSGA